MSLVTNAVAGEIYVQQIILKYIVFFSLIDPFQFLPKIEPAKEQAAQPALARKPTVIRIPAKPEKCKFFS